MSRAFGTKALFGLLIALFLVVSVGGVFSASMAGGDTASNCPFMGVPVLCAMNPLQHLSEWQQTFGAIMQQVATQTILLLILFIAALSFVRPLVFAPVKVAKPFDHAPPLLPQRAKATRWLSLFENSPSRL